MMFQKEQVNDRSFTEIGCLCEEIAGGWKEGRSCSCGSGESLRQIVEVQKEEGNAPGKIERPITAIRE